MHKIESEIERICIRGVEFRNHMSARASLFWYGHCFLLNLSLSLSLSLSGRVLSLAEVCTGFYKGFNRSHVLMPNALNPRTRVAPYPTLRLALCHDAQRTQGGVDTICNEDGPRRRREGGIQSKRNERGRLRAQPRYAGVEDARRSLFTGPEADVLA